MCVIDTGSKPNLSPITFFFNFLIKDQLPVILTEDGVKHNYLQIF